MQKQHKIVGISEAAAILGVHRNTLRKWADDGIVPHLKLPSGYRRFSVAELERFREEMERGGEDGEMGKAAARSDLAAA